MTETIPTAQQKRLAQLASIWAFNRGAGKLDLTEVVDLLKTLPPVDAAYLALNYASFVPDSEELELRAFLTHFFV